MGIITDFIQLWGLLDDFQLQPELDDSHTWRLAANGKYSAKSCYENLFIRVTSFKPCDRISRTWAPPKCRVFLWLSTHK
jgi:hypothetical protein